MLNSISLVTLRGVIVDLIIQGEWHEINVVLFKARIKPVNAKNLNETNLQTLMGVSLVGFRIAVQIEPAKNSKRVICYAYARPDGSIKIGNKMRSALEKTWQTLCNDKKATVSRLVGVIEFSGASSGELVNAHYVVETDADKGWFKEIGAWYDTEHMPKLAAVTGTVHAARFMNIDHTPKSVACYDLKEASVMGSAPWLAVRASDWSDRCRPHFCNTLRTMLRVSGERAAKS